MRVRFCYCFVPFKMKGTNIWGKVWKQEQFLVKARVKVAAKLMDLGKTKDFSIFSCSASGNPFLTNAFNWSGLVFPCLKLGIKLYRNHCKDLEISLLQNSLECEVLWTPHVSGGMTLLYTPLWASLTELASSRLVLDQPLAILNSESVAEHHSSSATLQSLSG